jgi:hypothetical protein
LWSGKIISGRYAQHGDSHSGLELMTFIPKELLGSGFAVKGSLPHHNEIAVDGDAVEKGHVLYQSSASGATGRMCFENQFMWRKQTAIGHIRAAFQANWTG